MRREALRFGLVAAAALAAALPAGQALGQSPSVLRGSQDSDGTDGDGTIALPPPPIGGDRLVLRKPDAVSRIRSAKPALAPADNAFPTPALEQEAAPERSPVAEEDPYAPLGLRAGAFLLRPSIEVDFGYDDNPGQQPGNVEGAAFTRVAPALAFESDWTRHALRGAIDGSYTRYFGIEDPGRPELDALLAGRLDLRRDTAIESELRLSLDTERIGDDGVPETATRRPLTAEYGSTIGIVQRFGPSAVTLKGSVDRNEYERVDDVPGRDYATYGVALRGSYEISPAVQPFVEVGTDWRRHDDAATSYRDSQGARVMGGAVLDLTGALKGEASAGYGARRYDSATLEDISGVLANASLVWTPTPLTTITLTAGTSFDETTETGSSGYVSRTAGVTLAHALRRNLVATASLSYETDTYDGIERVERTVDAGLGVEYRLSRTTAVRGRYAYERLASTVPGADYTASSIMVGLRLQR